MIDYIQAAGWQVMRSIGVVEMFRFLSVIDKVHQLVDTQKRDTWYLDSIAIKLDHQGKNLGSKMINDCIVPFIEYYGEGELTLITTTEQNRVFYCRNEFIEEK